MTPLISCLLVPHNQSVPKIPSTGLTMNYVLKMNFPLEDSSATQISFSRFLCYLQINGKSENLYSDWEISRSFLMCTHKCTFICVNSSLIEQSVINITNMCLKLYQLKFTENRDRKLTEAQSSVLQGRWQKAEERHKVAFLPYQGCSNCV
jgi:hypothetical protein